MAAIATEELPRGMWTELI
jgi:hypothetical protein